MTKTTLPPPIIFDPQRQAATPELRAALKSLIAFLERREADLGLRQRARKAADRKSLHLAIEAIACNLAILPLLDPSRPLAVPRSSGVMWAKGRYRNPVYGQHFLDALDLMANPKVGLIYELRRGYRFTAANKQPSTVRPNAVFAEHVSPSLISWEAFNRAEEPEVLILKGPKSDDTGIADAIAYPDTRETRRMRKEVQRVNGWLRKAPFKIVGDNDGALGVDDDDGQPVDPTRRSVRRIFNNGSWQEGGRLFHGFWETMRRPDRFRLLRICTAATPDGEPVANVDFSHLFPTLAYQAAKCPLPERDLYDFFGDGTCRDGFKKLMNALLFADGTMTRWPRETSELFAGRAKLRDALALVRYEHAPIAHLFGTRIGYRFMFIESGILIKALHGCYVNGITALPLHDSVLVARSEAEAAKAIMEQAFEEATGESRGKLKVDFGKQYQ